MDEEDRRIGVLRELRAYRNNMSEFDEEDMDYLILLVEIDIMSNPDKRII